MEFPLLILSVTPPLLILWYFQASDRYPEPPRVVWTAFLLGMLASLPAAVVGSGVDALASGMPGGWAKGSWQAFFAAALPEELAKFLVLYFYCGRRSEFDEPMDGLVYGTAVSLGFASLENVQYVFGQHGGWETAIVRAVTAVPSHGADGAIMGYFFSLWRHGGRNRKEFLLLALAVPAALHGLYDMMVLVADALPAGDPAVTTLWVTWLCFIAVQLFLVKLLLDEHVRRQEAGLQVGDLPSYVRLRRRNRRRVGWAIVMGGGCMMGLAAFVPWLEGFRVNGVVLGVIVVRTGWMRLRD